MKKIQSYLISLGVTLLGMMLLYVIAGGAWMVVLHVLETTPELWIAVWKMCAIVLIIIAAVALVIGAILS